MVVLDKLIAVAMPNRSPLGLLIRGPLIGAHLEELGR